MIKQSFGQWLKNGIKKLRTLTKAETKEILKVTGFVARGVIQFIISAGLLAVGLVLPMLGGYYYFMALLLIPAVALMLYSFYFVFTSNDKKAVVNGDKNE